MSRPSATAARRRPAAGRRGTILIVVLALLTIFAVIGISFVFYSDGEALAARYHRESQTRNGVGLPPPPQSFDLDAETALASVIFGAAPNDANAQLNAFRGQDLLTGIYGAYGKRTDDTDKFSLPYSGPGIIHENLGTATWTEKGFAAVSDRAHVVNHTVINVGGKYLAFDPEISGEPRDVASAAPPQPTDLKSLPAGKSYVPKNAPYTYPDLNNFPLASISPATGEVLVPSYFRSWHFNGRPVQLSFDSSAPPAAPLDQRLAGWNPSDTVLKANTDWVTAEGKARILRPRPIDQLLAVEIQGAVNAIPPLKGPPTEAELGKLSVPQLQALYKAIDDRIRSGDILGYPRPNAPDGLTTTGDVQNFLGGVGVQRHDSLLLDYGAAPFEWPPRSGKYAKPLVAVLITDADGSLDLNAHGNVRDAGNHVSYHGIGPWEVNLGAAAANTNEANALVLSRYGSTKAAKALDNSTKNAFDRSDRRLGAYGQVNWDAAGSIAKGSKAVLIPSFATGANPFAVVPNYETGFFDDNTTATKAQDHPSLYNPSDATPFPDVKSLNPLPSPAAAPNGYTVQQYGFSYATQETRRLRQRYAGELDIYQQMAANKTVTPASGTLIGSNSAGPTFRLDQAHPRRLLFTTLSAGLDLPATMPQGEVKDKSLDLAMLSGPYTATTQTQPHPTNTGLVSKPSWGYANLGPVDLNRPLADYRTDTTNPLYNANNVTAASANKAWADRHNLARDVFIRLALGTGASGAGFDKNGAFTLPAPPTDTSAPEYKQYNALRYLAQVAANVVDYIDGDDVTTAFVWNPEDSASSSDPKTGLLPVVDESSVVSTATTAMVDQENRNNRVVFGVEMPRLVINEVYSEVVEDNPKGKGKGMAPGLGRFWVELLNPTTPASPTGKTDGPLGTGKVILKTSSGTNPYKLIITRSKTATGNAGDDIRYNPANVAGDPTWLAGKTTFTPDIVYDFGDAGNGGVTNTELEPNNGQYDPSGDPAKGIVVVGPKTTGAAAGQEFDPASITPAPGWVAKMIVTPNAPAVAGTQSTGLEYRIAQSDMAMFDPTVATSDYRRNVVLLQRLANPYLAFDAKTNPYVTVDVMDYVPSNDAVAAAGGSPGGPTLPSRYAVGRVQPYAGQAAPDTAAAMTPPAYSFPNSCLVQQSTSPSANEPKHTFGRHNGATSTAPTSPTVTPAPMNAGETTAVTGLTGGETIMAPFDWLTHLDRPLVNQLELLQLQAVKPHEVTYYFVQPPTQSGQPIRKQVGQAPWLGVVEPSAAAPQSPSSPYTIKDQGRSGIDFNAQSVNALYRGLEYLRVKPWTYGVGSGARVHGRINLNTVQDIRVWTALTDAQDSRKASGFTSTDSDNLWPAYITNQVIPATPPMPPATAPTPIAGVRTYTSVQKTDAISQNWTVPLPGETVDDADAFVDPNPNNYAKRLKTLDRPFKPFGVVDAPLPPTDPAVKTWSPPMVAPAGAGLQDTFLRASPDKKTNLPMLWSATQTHPYLEAELPRKLLNNTTTVSNVFCVRMTVVYHEVRLDPTTKQPMAEVIPASGATLQRYYLGREVYRELPGDLRQQYVAIVDRSNAVLQPTGTTDLAPQPFYSALSAAVKAGDTKMTLTNASTNSTNSAVLVYADGQPVTINAGTKLVVGSGIDAETVEVSSVTANAGEVNLKSALAKPHATGVVVTNAALGRPVQPSANFNPIQYPTAFQYRLLIPYAARVR